MSGTPRCRIAILAAGTGGHVLPALEVAQGLRAEGAHIEWLGAGLDLERRLVDAAGFPYTDIGAIGFVGRGALGQLSSLLLNGLALLRAIVWMQRRRPDIVFGFGGYICVSGGLAAHLCRIPLILHEQNAVPGRANRLCARWARIGFEGIPGGFSGLVETHPSGNPVRPDIAALPEPGRRYAERGTAPLRLLVLGGSSGAEQLNQALPALLGGRSDLEVRHQCGAGRSEAVRVRYAEAGVGHVEVEDFIADMASAYGWADLAITRAGAMTISELAAAGLPALLWPLPFSTDDHQRRNAERVSPPCGVIDSAESLGQHLPDWLGSRERLAERAAAMRAFHLPGAVESIVQTVLGEFA